MKKKIKELINGDKFSFSENAVEIYVFQDGIIVELVGAFSGQSLNVSELPDQDRLVFIV